MLNVTTDKVEHCRSFGIEINREDWNCNNPFVVEKVGLHMYGIYATLYAIINKKNRFKEKGLLILQCAV